MIQKIKYFVFGFLVAGALAWAGGVLAGEDPKIVGGRGYLRGITVTMKVYDKEYECSEPYWSGQENSVLECSSR